LAYDSESDLVILSGGGIGQDVIVDDTWAHDSVAGQWARMEPPRRPGVPSFGAMVYDAESDRIIWHGGVREIAHDKVRAVRDLGV
jgi:hypothetical protein